LAAFFVAVVVFWYKYRGLANGQMPARPLLFKVSVKVGVKSRGKVRFLLHFYAHATVMGLGYQKRFFPVPWRCAKMPLKAQ